MFYRIDRGKRKKIILYLSENFGLESHPGFQSAGYEKDFEMRKQNRDDILKREQLIGKKTKNLYNGIAQVHCCSNHFIAEPLYSSLLQMSPVGICITDFENGIIFDASDIFCQITGYAKNEIIGKTRGELELWLDTDQHDVLRLLSEYGQFKNLEMKHRKKDGTIFTSLDSGELKKIGDKIFIIEIMIDITSQKLAEGALIEERDLNNTIVDSLPGLFFVLDDHLKLIRWNRNFMKITGYSAEEIQKMTVLDFVPESGRCITYEKIKNVFVSGEFSAESDVVLKDGTFKTFLFSAKYLNFNDKPSIVGNGVDITVRKRALEELSRSAHELEEANTALRVFMKNQAADQQFMEKKLQTNINDLVIPYLKKLKQANIDDRFKKYLSTLEANLSDILSPYMTNFLSSHKTLSPQQIQIADLIKMGKNTKEIAEILNASINTIATHRNNIRKKLNLRNSKSNLRSYLLSIK